MDDDSGEEDSDYDVYGGFEANEDGAESGGSSDIFVLETVESPPPPLKDRVLLLLDGSEERADHGQVRLSQDVWGYLPEDLLEKVFVWLPAPSICRMRVVCKFWKGILSDETVLAQHASNSATEPAFMKFVEQFERRPGDPPTLVATKWSLVGLDFVPGYRFSSVATARGLLCCLLDSFQASTAPSILVVNPLTKTWIILPNPPNSIFQAAMSMVYVEDTQAYVVVVVNHRIFNPLNEPPEIFSLQEYDSGDSDSENVHYVITADIFDTGENTWRTATHVFQARVEGAHIFCNGSIYWLATHHEPGTGLNVISYSFSKDSWSCFRLPHFTLLREFPEAEGAHCISCNLVGVQARVFLAAEVVQKENPHEISISIWEYQEQAVWQHVDSISADIYTALLGNPTNRGVLNFVGYGDVMWISLHGSATSLAYDFQSKSLRRLPDCPFHVEERAAESDSFTRLYRMPALYGFQPRLDPVERAFANP